MALEGVYPQQDQSRRCGDCIHYKKNPNQLNQGNCHRFPPQVVGIPVQSQLGGVDIKGMTIYPTVNVDGWGCAEFKRNWEVNDA